MVLERVATRSELQPGQLKLVQVGGEDICLANVDGEVYAFKDNCSHKDFPLSSGALEDDVIECAWHGARFDVKTGRALALPAIKPIRTYEVRVEGGRIMVAVS
jgi:nitrite reductase/ring-hydroxylating ferredoxin subunit